MNNNNHEKTPYHKINNKRISEARKVKNTALAIANRECNAALVRYRAAKEQERLKGKVFFRKPPGSPHILESIILSE